MNSTTIHHTTGRPLGGTAARLFRRVCTLLAAVSGLALGHAAPPEKFQQMTSPDEVPQGLAKSDWQSIRAAYEAGRHEFQPIEGRDGHWQARNPGQQWTTRFDGRGFIATPRDGGWTWGLELVSYGRGAAQQTVKGQPAVKAAGQRLSYQWDAALQEWWVNDQRGLEHGYTVKERPQQQRKDENEISDKKDDASSHQYFESFLSLTLKTRGSLTPKISPDALGVLFHDATGATELNYTGLKVWDADGKVLASRFESAGARRVRLCVEDRAARYPITIDPIAQQAYLKASQVNIYDSFGFSVAVSGDTVVVGAYQEASSTTGINSTPDELALGAGAAYVFVRSGTTWSQQAYLKASHVHQSDYFGASVAVSGDTVVVGAPREASSTTGINSTPDELALGAGAAYVFVRSGTAWSQQAYLKASHVTANDYFGASVAVSGDTVVVGAYWEDSSTTGINSTPDELAFNAGAAYVFVRSGTAWSQQAYLKASQVTKFDQFGTSVAVSGDTVVVGAPLEASSTTGINSTPNESAPYAGAAYVFVRSGTAWSQQAYLKASHVTEGDNFGYSVAVSGDTVVVGANGEASSTTGINSTPDELALSAGAAYVFVRSGTTWSQQAYLKASHVTTGDYFGYSVAVSGDTVVVGAASEDSSTTGINSTPNESASNAGAAYVFVRRGTTWSQQAYLKASHVTAEDFFGFSVAVSGYTVVVGTPREDSSTTGINSTPNESATDAGAAYIFTGLGPATAPVVSAPTITSVLSTTATLGGDVTADGGAAITERGVVYSLTSVNADPLISGTGVTQVPASGTTGVFTVPITGLTSLSGYSFKAYATNSVGTTYTTAATFVTAANVPPTFSGYALSTPRNISATVGAANILTRAADSDGGTLSLTAVSANSTQSGLVSLQSETVTYNPPLNFTGLDTFTVTISDGQGGTVTGIVTVNVTDGSGAAQNQTQITRQPGGNMAVLFRGIPGQDYRIQRSTDLQNWSTMSTVTAAPDGTLPYTDTAPPPGTAFYRTAPANR